MVQRASRACVSGAQIVTWLTRFCWWNWLRWARKVGAPRALDPDQLDLEILALIASLRHVLTSQVHRRFNAGRAATTTQRRLKRLSDAGLLERFQFHRRDGGGVPMCCVITPEGRQLVYRYTRNREPMFYDDL